MAITLRASKGSPLSHSELDQNFKEFFYSASVEGSAVKFHKYTALSSSISFPVDPPSGKDGYIQLKSGNAISGANAVHTGSIDLRFDYQNSTLKLTGSSIIVGDTSTTGHVSITGSAKITGDVTIDGNLRAEQFITTITTSSIVYQSGSTQFGDTEDDTHIFTGKVSVSNGITGSTDFNTLVNKPTLVSSSVQLASDITGSFTELSSSVAERLDARIITASSSTNIITFTKGDLSTFSVTVDTGSFTLTSTGSLITTASADQNVITFTKGDSSTFDITIITGSDTGLLNLSEDTTPQLGGNLDLNNSNISGSGNINTTGNLNITGFVSASGAYFSGSVTSIGDITAFYSSDERLKDNITPIVGAIDKVNQIGGYEFDWNDNSEHSGHDIGVIAQEIEKVLPEIVVNRDNGYKAVRYEKIVALLIQAVKEQQLQIDELKSKL